MPGVDKQIDHLILPAFPKKIEKTHTDFILMVIPCSCEWITT
jgi:hypothetical protein